MLPSVQGPPTVGSVPLVYDAATASILACRFDAEVLDSMFHLRLSPGTADLHVHALHLVIMHLGQDPNFVQSVLASVCSKSPHTLSVAFLKECALRRWLLLLLFVHAIVERG